MKNLLKDSKAYYEDNDYYEIFSISEDYLNKVTDYLDNISKNKRVLDAGCGTGKYLSVLERNSTKYIGLDLSNKQLDKARTKVKKDNTELICSNLSKIPLENNSVDLVVSCWVLGTITDLEERNKVLKELKRVGSTIILVENATNSEFEMIRDRDKDNRTKDYNDWILSNGFVLDETIDTYFEFKSFEECQKCFEVIYGSEVASRIKDKRIEHKINIYKYKKTL